MTRIRIETPVNPTENITKVKAAVLNLFPDAVFKDEDIRLTAEAQSLERFKELLQNQAIRDAARAVLRSSLTQGGIRFSLNKQTSYVGKVNFAPPSPLGEIVVTIDDDDAERLIDILTGRIEDGVDRSGVLDRD